MNRADRITSILTGALEPSHLELRDESAKHAGHSGARVEGETHYFLSIKSEAFRGKSKVACHQMIYGLLGEEFKAGLHALSIIL